MHFGHKGIIGLCNRPFDSVEEMDNTLINNWNATVRREDEIYILGDIFWCKGEQAKAYLSVLSGKKYLVVGNHDKFLRDFGEIDGWFEWVKDYAVVNYNGVKLVLFHYPIAEWDGFYKGAIHLYGHVHQSKIASLWTPSNIRAFNVGVDVCDFSPISINEVIMRANKMAVTGGFIAE